MPAWSCLTYNFLREITRLRVKFSDKRILMPQADISDASKDVRVAPEHAQKLLYVADDLLVADIMRLMNTFGWAGSPGSWVSSH